MSRFRPPCLVLSVLSVLLTALPAAGQVLPLASVANWSALSLEGGILYTRVTGSPSGPVFVFAAPAADDNIELLVYRDGPDAAAAFGSLHSKLALSSGDYGTLKEFALGLPLVPGGTWDPLTFGDGYVIAADPAMGGAGTRLYAALLALETESFATSWIGGAGGRAKDAVVLGQTPCGMLELTALESDEKVTGGISAFAKVLPVTEGSNAAFKAAAKLCLESEYPYDPAFPVLTPPVYPTAFLPWAGYPCSPVGLVGDCIDGNGNFCKNCNCVQAGGNGRWSALNCAPITATAVGTACAPVGGKGPCTKGTKTCVCTCKAATAPATGGVWASPTKCGSAEIAALFLLLAGGLAWRRRLAM